MVVIVAGNVFFGFSKSPFAVLAPDEMVIYVVLWLLWAGMIAALGSLLCQGIEFLEKHEGDRYFNGYRIGEMANRPLKEWSNGLRVYDIFLGRLCFHMI